MFKNLSDKQKMTLLAVGIPAMLILISVSIYLISMLFSVLFLALKITVFSTSLALRLLPVVLMIFGLYHTVKYFKPDWIGQLNQFIENGIDEIKKVK